MRDRSRVIRFLSCAYLFFTPFQYQSSHRDLASPHHSHLRALQYPVVSRSGRIISSLACFFLPHLMQPTLLRDGRVITSAVTAVQILSRLQNVDRTTRHAGDGRQDGLSTCQPPDTAQGTHVFLILGYSKHRGLGFHSAVQSAAFAVVGHHWAIVVYPDGCGGQEPETTDFIAVYFHLLSTGAKVHASCDIRLVDHYTGVATSVIAPADNSRRMPYMFMPLREVEKTNYLKNDRLTVECVVTVRKDPRASKTKAFPMIKAPPSDIKQQLANLLEQKEGTDVMFSDAGETFAAHKIMLAMRPPVFKAELCSPLSDTRKQPDVFRALLYFIYTDSMNGINDVDGDSNRQNCEMIRHLLVAEDRYDVERLKLICQSILCQKLHVRNVATTLLALSDQHHFDRLKGACIEFMSCFEYNR